MKRLFFLLVAGMLSIGIQKAKASQNADTGILAGNWFLLPVLPSDTASGKIPTINFNLSQNKFTGFTGCNKMSGSFQLKGDQLSFNAQVDLTKIACQGYNEKEFITNLLRVTNYKMDKGILILMINNTPVSKWVRRIETRQIAITHSQQEEWSAGKFPAIE